MPGVGSKNILTAIPPELFLHQAILKSSYSQLKRAQISGPKRYCLGARLFWPVVARLYRAAALTRALDVENFPVTNVGAPQAVRGS